MSRGPKQDRVVPKASGVRQACLALKPVVGIPIPGVTFSVVIVGDQGHPGNWADDVQRTLRFCRLALRPKIPSPGWAYRND